MTGIMPLAMWSPSFGAWAHRAAIPTGHHWPLVEAPHPPRRARPLQSSHLDEKSTFGNLLALISTGERAEVNEVEGY